MKETKHYLGLLGNDLPALTRCWALKWKSVFVNYPVLPSYETEKTPILFVHGYMHNNSAWLDFREVCDKKEMGPIFTPSLRRSMDDIRSSALEVSRWVRIIQKMTGKQKVIIVGHSLGGIAATYCAQNLVNEGDIEAVITLGSPLKGTKLATIGIGKAAFQMQQGSTLLRRLVASVEETPRTRYYHFLSKADEAVRPYTAAYIQEPHKIYEDIGHSSMLFTPAVIEDVLSVVQTLDQSPCSENTRLLVWTRKESSQEALCSTGAGAT